MERLRQEHLEVAAAEVARVKSEQMAIAQNKEAEAKKAAVAAEVYKQEIDALRKELSQTRKKIADTPDDVLAHIEENERLKRELISARMDARSEELAEDEYMRMQEWFERVVRLERGPTRGASTSTRR